MRETKRDKPADVAARDRAAGLARREIIGLSVRVESPDRGFDGLAGRVVDETKHTFVVETAPGAEKRVPKTGNRFAFRDGAVVVAGDDITFQPEDRTKKVRG